ncbi:MAG: hypothetical protein ACOYK8_09995 [Alphaproteobacteria bacterium]
MKSSAPSCEADSQKRQALNELKHIFPDNMLNMAEKIICNFIFIVI